MTTSAAQLRMSLITTHDIAVAPIGLRVGNLAPTNPSVCWYCAHEFSWDASFIPVRTFRTKQYVPKGHFCTFECAKAYAIRSGKGGRTSSTSEIALIANKCFRAKAGNENQRLFLKALPPIAELKKFGGEMSIDEFRNGCTRFDGSTVGETGDVLDDLLTESHRNKFFPTFFCTTELTSVSCVTNMGKLVTASDITVSPVGTLEDGAPAKKGRKRSRVGTPAPRPPATVSETIRSLQIRPHNVPTEAKKGRRNLLDTMGIRVS